MKKSKSVNNLTELYNVRINNFLNNSVKGVERSVSYSMDSLVDILDDDTLNHSDISKILKKCTYICDVCKNDYMFKCIECESAKYFEYEVEKQRYINSIKSIQLKKYYSLDDFIEEY